MFRQGQGIDQGHDILSAKLWYRVCGGCTRSMMELELMGPELGPEG